MRGPWPFRLAWLALGTLTMAAPVAAAERQIRPFAGATFGGGTTLVDLEDAAGRPNLVVGVTAAFLGEIVGVDVDFGSAPGFFQRGDQNLVLRSRVTTLTGNLVVAAPRRLTEYTLRPYFVGGLGLMRVNVLDVFGVLKVADTLLTSDLGAGVIGFFTSRVGVSWDVRRFRSFARNSQTRGFSFGPEQLSFWRASMALAIRY